MAFVTWQTSSRVRLVSALTGRDDPGHIAVQTRLPRNFRMLATSCIVAGRHCAGDTVLATFDIRILHLMRTGA